MRQLVLVLTTSAAVLLYAAMPAAAQQSPGGPAAGTADQQQTQQQFRDRDATGTTGQGAGWAAGGMAGGMGPRGMMGPNVRGPHRAMAPVILRVIFALMDTDGDGTIELPEFQAAHERIFKAMDANKDGKLTFEEMLAFMRGRPTPPPQPPQ